MTAGSSGLSVFTDVIEAFPCELILYDLYSEVICLIGLIYNEDVSNTSPSPSQGLGWHGHPARVLPGYF